MIWASTLAMTILDLLIVSMILVMLAIVWSQGMFRKRNAPRTGRFLIVAGVLLTGLFYVADLLTMHVFAPMFGAEQAMQLMGALHLEIRWGISLVSSVVICAGIVLDTYHRNRIEKRIRFAERQVAAASALAIESEIRFRSLLEQSPDSLFCVELQSPVPITADVDELAAGLSNTVLVECNQDFADLVGAQSPEDIVGKHYGDLDVVLADETMRQVARGFAQSGFRLVDYHLKHTMPRGNPRISRVSMTGVIRDGKLEKIWGTEKDIIEEQETRIALSNRLEFENFASKISKDMLTAPDNEFEDAIVRCLAQIAGHFDVDRANIIWFERDSREVQLLYFWNELNRAPWDSFPLAQFPEIEIAFEKGETISVSSPADIPEDASQIKNFIDSVGVRSFLLVPLVVRNEAVGGLLIATSRQQRNWSKGEDEDLQGIARLLANRLLRFNNYKELTRLTSELQVAKERLEAENVVLREEIDSSHGFAEIIGESDVFKQCLHLVTRVSKTSTPVLLLGETGTGKELFAKAIHEHSGRADQPLVRVNCAALPATLIESELFGHEKGAFTGAESKRPGRFELADRGTLFLDEIAELPLELQSKLLRVLQAGEFERVGGKETLKVDVRIIAATNRNLADAIEQRRFRSDLYYRIGTFPITLPPLRERGKDISLLAQHLVMKHAGNLGKSIAQISASMMAELENYDWPGNVRELEAVIQRALIASQGPVLHLAAPLADASPAPGPDIVSMDLHANEREHIKRVLERSNWVITGRAGAATKLGVPPSTLRSKMKRLGIERPGTSPRPD